VQTSWIKVAHKSLTEDKLQWNQIAMFNYNKLRPVFCACRLVY
jgi:hypothetical protein